MPTIEVQIAETRDDGYLSVSSEGSGGVFINTVSFCSMGNVSDTDRRSAFFNFKRVQIPKGATITAAYIRFTANVTQSFAGCNLRIWGNDGTTSPASPSDAAGYWTLTKTTASVDWNGVEAWTAESTYNSPDISTIVQELVDSYGPYTGIQIIIWNNASSTTGRRAAYDYTGGSTKAAVLHIEYTITDSGTTWVSASGDDGRVSGALEDAGATFENTGGYILAGVDTVGEPRCSYIMFRGVTIPAGATITEAKLIAIKYQSQSSTTVNTNFWGNDSATPSAPTTTTEYWDLVKTTQFVAWDNIPPMVDGEVVLSPDIKAIIQELVDTYDYSSGRDLQLMWWDDGSSTSAWRNLLSYDDDSYQAGKSAPALYITWTTAATGWPHQIYGVTPASVMGIDVANITSVNGIE